MLLVSKQSEQHCQRNLPIGWKGFILLNHCLLFFLLDYDYQPSNFHFSLKEKKFHFICYSTFLLLFRAKLPQKYWLYSLRFFTSTLLISLSNILQWHKRACCQIHRNFSYFIWTHKHILNSQHPFFPKILLSWLLWDQHSQRLNSFPYLSPLPDLPSPARGCVSMGMHRDPCPP